MAEHGTAARYQKHKRDGEEACQECKDGWNANQKRLFAENPKVLEDEKKRKRAVGRAQSRLRKVFRVEYEVFYQEELAKEYGEGSS